MPSVRFLKAAGVLLVARLASAVVEDGPKKHHHHKHHHHRHNGTVAPHLAAAAPAQAATLANTDTIETAIAGKLKKIEGELANKEKQYQNVDIVGKLQVNGPLPVDFSERFKQVAARSVPCDPDEVNIVESYPLDKTGSLVEVVFQAPMDIVHEIEDQSADPKSKFTNSPLKEFLVKTADSPTGLAPEVAMEAARSTGGAGDAYPYEGGDAPKVRRDAYGNVKQVTALVHSQTVVDEGVDADQEPAAEQATPVASTGIDIDTAMPYGELEPFGREDTAQELTEQSIGESDEMVDQLERAEVAEEKRAVFRALTRLRGAAITSFDGVARSQTGNIDEYNKVHKWRTTHPLRHLADEESDVAKWAFPDDADF